MKTLRRLRIRTRDALNNNCTFSQYRKTLIGMIWAGSCTSQNSSVIQLVTMNTKEIKLQLFIFQKE